MIATSTGSAPRGEYTISGISLGEGSISEDLEELKNKDLTIPTYLTKLPSVLTGPDVFEFLEW